MNTLFRQLFRGVPAALFLALTLGALAQQAPVPKEKSTSPDTPPAAAAPDTPAPAATPAAPGDVTSPTAPAVEAETPEQANKGLRRIDVTPENRDRNRANRRHNNRGEFPIGDHFVPKGSDIHDAVSVFGSTTVEGEVHSDAVSVLGDTRIGPNAKVGGAAVAVLGRLTVEGEVRDEAVSVLGGAYINGKVGSEVVSVLGDLHLGPKAVVNGDLVIVGGKLTKDPDAIVRGNEVNVPILGAFGSIEWLTSWMKQCLFKGRPLAFGPNLGWAWMVAFSFLAFYLLLALLFPSVIEKCAVTLETRPGSSILASVLTVLLTPIAIVLLAVTIVGGLLVPFLGAGLFFAGLFGKAVMLAWIGRRFTKFFGTGPLGHPVFAVLIGGVIVLLLYTVWGSFLLYKLLSWLGLGVVVYTIALSMKREKPAVVGAGPIPPVDLAGPSSGFAPDTPQPPTMSSESAEASELTSPMMPVAPESPVMPATPVVPPPVASPGFTGSPGGVSDAGAAGSPYASGFTSEPLRPAMGAVPPPARRPAAQSFAPRPPTISANTLPRAGFFPRLAAMALDGILIGMLVGFTSNVLPRTLRFHEGPGGLLLALAIYAAVMWKTKGTTIGGIVCGLKVVRIDNREIDWATAIVRALGCFLSLAVAGLGFIWVAFDDEKQSWHDKIAGTTVVRVPKGASLL